MDLEPCTSCRRHVEPRARSCPFCAAVLALVVACKSDPAPPPPTPRAIDAQLADAGVKPDAALADAAVDAGIDAGIDAGVRRKRPPKVELPLPEEPSEDDRIRSKLPYGAPPVRRRVV